MKRIITLLLAFTLLLGTLTGCGAPGNPGAADAAGEKDDDSLKIVTTIFPEYDWVMNILGDKAGEADVAMLLDNGVDLHSFQPASDDVMRIAQCDLFIYVGGESDEWVEDALKEATNENMITLNLLEVLGEKVKEEEVVEGMEAEEEGEEGEEEGPEYDEHVWLSLKNTQILCDAIEEALAKLDPENADLYRANADAYKAELAALDAEYEKAVEDATVKTLLFGDRFPFRYLTDDYGLDYYAAFVGCSAETEASFETIVFLADKTEELKLPAIMKIEGNNPEIAETIRSNTAKKDQQILTLDSMQSTTSEDVKNGTTYLSVMRQNLEVLRKALGVA